MPRRIHRPFATLAPSLPSIVLLLGAAIGAPGCASEAIGFYQQHLGNQWAFHCAYQPSCSNYGKQAVATYGAVPGTLMTADRLMRDHDFEPQDYAHDEYGRPIDPPADNALFGPRDEDPETIAAAQARDDADAQRAPLADDFDEEAQLRFADDLFESGDLDRARVEYLRLLHHHPQSAHATKCHERIALCLAHVARRSEALAEAEKIADPAERERTRALVLRELDRPVEALDAAQAGGSPLLSGMLAIEAGRADVARESFAGLEPRLRDELLGRVDELEALPSRSPWLAGSMSAVLPGSGQLYAGRPADGAVAFLTNALLIGGTVVAARNDEDVTAVALGFVAFGFYAGNVYGAANAAVRHDREQRDGLSTRTRGWLRQSGFWVAPTPDGEGGALGLYLRL
jgi:putative component of membrane protein insertase Oxa1/YidC/SpoIIIJ protein YidD